MNNMSAKYPLFDQIVTLNFDYYIRNGVPQGTIETCSKIIRRTAEIIDACVDRPQTEKECLMVAALALKMEMKLAPDVAPFMNDEIMRMIRNVYFSTSANADVCPILIAERISGLETQSNWDKAYLSDLRKSIEESMEIAQSPRLNALFDETCARLQRTTAPETPRGKPPRQP